MAISVESAEAEAKNNPETGSALSTLLKIRSVKDVPKWVWLIGIGVIVLCVLNRKESKPNVLPAGAGDFNPLDG